jgi:CRISPR/Cas system CSM-associated protein Csm4 (group 5 of RAMP superfamily)
VQNAIISLEIDVMEDRKMDYIPSWLQEAVDSKELVCPVCEAQMDCSNIVALGIKKAEEDVDEFFFIEYDCKDCKHRISISIKEMDVEEFAFDVLEDVGFFTEEDRKVPEELQKEVKKSDPPKQKARKRVKTSSKISSSELEEFKRDVKDIKYFDDFLDYMGIDHNIDKKDLMND